MLAPATRWVGGGCEPNVFGDTTTQHAPEAPSMSAVPAGVDPDAGPPTTIPLGHFVVGLAFLAAGALVGLGTVTEVLPALGRRATVHLLLAGWVCVTIMGAMTQFVPVWAGATLYSRRLASLQLLLVTIGLPGFALSFLLGALPWVHVFGTLLLLGFWVFVYNLGRTLLGLDGLDVTTGHFAFGLASFAALTVFGYLLALSFATPAVAALPVSHGGIRGAHVTVAVFGAILSTVYGALYQLGPMFTQTEFDRPDRLLQRLEITAHPLGVALLAAGRLIAWPALARVGAMLVLLGALAVAVVLGRTLVRMRVPRTQMHTHYAVAAVALAGWALGTAPAWLTAPSTREVTVGASSPAGLLLFVAIGFVVLGTLYHVVPFIVWLDRYSDRLGLEQVPMIDDLYDDRLASVSFGALVAGTALALGALTVGLGSLAVAGAALVVSGGTLAVAALLGVLREHDRRSVRAILLAALVPARRDGDPSDAGGTETDAARS